MRLRDIFTACAVLAALLVTAGPAAAASSVTVKAPPTTKPDRTVNIVYEGTADSGPDGVVLRAFYEVNAPNCAATAAAQRARPKAISDGSQYVSEIGAFSFTSSQRFSDVGAYRFCAYLQTYQQTDATAPIATAEAVLQVGTPPKPCKVPSVRGLTLKAAAAKLRASGCALGKVTRPKKPGKRTLVVKSQGAPSGTNLAAGAAVNVVLRAKPSRR